MKELLNRLLNTSTIVAVASGFILFFYAWSLLLNEWKVGNAMHEGHLRVVHVGLHNVLMKPTDAETGFETISLRELCEMGDPDEEDGEDWRRRRSLRGGDIPMFETPRAVWCTLADQGASTNGLMLFAWVPALMVCTWSMIRMLQHMVPQAAQAAKVLDRVEAMGLTETTIDTAMTALWLLYWFMILLAVTM